MNALDSEKVEKDGQSLTPYPLLSEHNTLSPIVEVLHRAIACAIDPVPSRLRLLMGPPRHTLGDYWVARPHLYLQHFDGQGHDSEATLNTCAGTLGQIFIGLPLKDDTRAFVPPDRRPLGDYAALVSPHKSAWVWSDAMFRSYTQEDRTGTLFDHKATDEALDFIAASHRALLERARSRESLRSILELKEATLGLRFHVRDSIAFGELRTLFDEAWNDYGIDWIRDEILNVLSTREALVSIAETRRNQRIGNGLTMVFGLVAVPPLANDVVRPVAALIGVGLPEDPLAAQVVLVLAAAVCVAILVMWVLWTDH